MMRNCLRSLADGGNHCDEAEEAFSSVCYNHNWELLVVNYNLSGFWIENNPVQSWAKRQQMKMCSWIFIFYYFIHLLPSQCNNILKDLDAFSLLLSLCSLSGHFFIP